MKNNVELKAPQVGEILPDGRRIVKVVPVQAFMIVVANENGEEERLIGMETHEGGVAQ